MPLHVKERGAGKPVVLIHGLFGSLENLGGIARELAKQHHVYSLDLPNHGRSLHTEDTSLPQMAATVYQWLQKQCLPHANFIGHSLGGKVAMELALTHPEAVDRLAVLDIAPVHYDPHHKQVFKGLLSLDPRTLKTRSEAEAILSQYVEEPAIRSFLLKNLVRGDEGFSWRMNLNSLYRNYPKLVGGNRSGACFKGRTLFLKGAKSNYIEHHHREEILVRFPHAQMKIVPGTGHWLHAEKPAMVSRLLQQFLM
ncbi:alpha/beta fold hydrolase [Teredinibacter haidensis]|uniref:alpha/beta fold hydrolase n=1 Tax=Teredinibacter haidensis TaxID=2731755 RepID=UPI000948D64E|nr:alpha/beta fold hydrolase [Teredinibacter haidensis]